MYQEFIQFFGTLKNTDCKIILHHNADPDAICAAKALGEFLKSFDLESTYELLADGTNTSTNRIISEMGIEVSSDIPDWDMDKFPLLITIDTANYSQLGHFETWANDQNCDLVVLDHHDTNEILEKARIGIVDHKSSSTCTIVTKLYHTAEIQPSSVIATLLISGHVYDSRRFLYGSSSEVFNQIAWLIECGGDFELANNVLQNQMTHGEKIARFKAASRLKYHTIGESIVITSKIGAYEASVARNFIGMGANVAFVLASKEKELRGSGRVDVGTNLNIGEILSTLASEFDGTGGGHAAAAGFNIPRIVTKKDQDKILKRFVELVKDNL